MLDQLSEAAPSSTALSVEQNVLAALVLEPDWLGSASRLTPDDFEHPVHSRLFSHMMEIHADKRPVSIVDLSRILGDCTEIEPGLTGTAYAEHLIDSCTLGSIKRFNRAVDALLDLRSRRYLSAVGTRLLSIGQGTASVTEAATAAVTDLDEIRAMLRPTQRQSFDPADGATAAIEHWQADATDDPTTGLEGLDVKLGRFARGQLTIIAARPAMGKSAVMLCAARKAAHKGVSSIVFSLEMTRQQIGSRMLADEAYTAVDPIHYEDLTNQTLEKSDRNRRRLSEAKARLDPLPIRFEEQRGCSASEIVGRIGKHIGFLESQGRRLDTVWVDHIGLVRASKRYAGNRHREVAEITDALATAAKEYNVAIIGMCQLNRGVEGRENKRPSLADLRDSGSIEEDASAVLFLYRPAYYLELQGVLPDPEKELDRQAQLQALGSTLEIIIAKNRNGRTGMVPQFVDIGANAVRPLAYGGRL